MPGPGANPAGDRDGSVTALSIKAGIKRDGTKLDGDYWSEGEHLRFRNGRPKKMGGRREVVNGLDGPISSVYVYSLFPQHQVHCFSTEGIQAFLVDINGVGAAPFSRTPGGFVPDADYLWQSTAMFDATGGGGQVIVAHPGLNASNYDQTTDTEVVYAGATGATPFVGIGESVSGGCVALQPYLFIYGNDGLIKNSAKNDPLDFATGDANTANVAPDKVVKGLPLRGGANAPAGLFWSLSSLIRVSFTGGTTKFRYDTVSDQTSIIAPNSPVEYDGVFYWPGADRFLLYNGVVKELPNPLNQDFFYDNLNWERQALVWGTKVPRWGEIWWFFPKGDSEVCNHAVIFNVREGTWYDTPLARSAGQPPKVLRWPMWSDALPNNESTPPGLYRFWQHEYGVDEIRGVVQVAIPSSCETSAFGYVPEGTTQDGGSVESMGTIISRIEPDITQVGPMTVEVTGGLRPRSPDETSAPQSFQPDDNIIDLREQRRMPRLRFASNVLGGDYFFGKLLVRMLRGDSRG